MIVLEVPILGGNRSSEGGLVHDTSSPSLQHEYSFISPTTRVQFRRCSISFTKPFPVMLLQLPPHAVTAFSIFVSATAQTPPTKYAAAAAAAAPAAAAAAAAAAPAAAAAAAAVPHVMFVVAWRARGSCCPIVGILTAMQALDLAVAAYGVSSIMAHSLRSSHQNRRGRSIQTSFFTACCRCEIRTTKSL
jgi:pyruvate/2-oxoglutarate dehydrogenase complex dihydrolipoamide acyltransferase (E2) component